MCENGPQRRDIGMRHAGIDDRAQSFPHSLALGERRLRSSSYVAASAAQLVAQIIRHNC